MGPSKKYSGKSAVGQHPDQQDFYRTRRKFTLNASTWAKARRVGKHWKILYEIVSRSKPSDPFCWVVTGTQKEWAESWGIPLSTLQRHLAAARAEGLLVGSVRESESIRSKHLNGVQFPVFTVPDEVVEEVSRWADPDFWPSPCKPQNEVYSQPPAPAPTDGQQDDNPVPTRDLEFHVTNVTLPLINKNYRDEQETVVPRGNRRLRRRRTPMKKFEDDYDPPVIGADPDRVQEPPARKVTTTVLAERAFDASWQAMFVKSPGLKMKLPLHPWRAGTLDKAFRGWLKNQFLPEIEGDLDRAKRIFDAFCGDLVSGREFVPGEQPPYRRLQTRLDRYAQLCPPGTTEERQQELEERQQELAEKFRPAAQDRRRGKVQKPSRVESQFFLD